MNNLSPQEVEKFSRTSSQWWQEGGAFAPLHALNRTRLEFITDAAPALTGLRVLDIGCGGGLVAEPLTRQGADVVAIDASSETIEVARAHAAKNNLTIDYRCAALEEVSEVDFDIVLALEIVEHVPDVIDFVRMAAAKLKVGGHIFFSTINRTPEAFVLTIAVAEYLLQKLPRGTHEYKKFVAPKTLRQALVSNGVAHLQSKGAVFNPLTGRFFLSNNQRVNYFMSGQKI